MKFLFSLCALLLPLAPATHAAPTYTAPAENPDTLCLRFASPAEARQLLGAEDNYTRQLSEFDLASRLGRTGGTKEELKALSLSEVREWNEAEKTELRRMQTYINRTIRQEGYRLPLPREVVLIKSGMADEGGAAGYTRSTEIVLADSLVGHRPEKVCTNLLLHEMFHVMTRHSPAFKRSMYATIGFEVVEKGLEYPAELRSRHITNPDINAYDCYATFTVNGRPERCAMLLYAEKPYAGGRFFDYLKVGFVPYDDQLKPIRKDGMPVVYSMDEVSDFYDKVGRNTGYTLHPEEILAENFVLAFRHTMPVKTPTLTEKIRSLLKGAK